MSARNSINSAANESAKSAARSPSTDSPKVFPKAAGTPPPASPASSAGGKPPIGGGGAGGLFGKRVVMKEQPKSPTTQPKGSFDSEPAASPFGAAQRFGALKATDRARSPANPPGKSPAIAPKAGPQPPAFGSVAGKSPAMGPMAGRSPAVGPMAGKPPPSPGQLAQSAPAAATSPQSEASTAKPQVQLPSGTPLGGTLRSDAGSGVPGSSGAEALDRKGSGVNLSRQPSGASAGARPMTPTAGLPRTMSQQSCASASPSQGSQQQQRLSRHSSQRSQGMHSQVETDPAVGQVEFADVASASDVSAAQNGGGAQLQVNLESENLRLSQQVESLQRLLHDSSNAVKINRLQDEVRDKAKLVTKLEKEKTELQGEVARLKKELAAEKKGSAKYSRRASKGGVVVQDAASKSQIDDDLDLALSESPRSQQLPASRSSLLPEKKQGSVSSMKEAPPLKSNALSEVDDAHNQVAELQDSVCTLRQHVAEQDAALHITNQKLEKAQDAIVAGISWEKEVKLSETRKALKKMLRSVTPNSKPKTSQGADTQPGQAASVRSATTNVGAVHSPVSIRSTPAFGNRLGSPSGLPTGMAPAYSPVSHLSATGRSPSTPAVPVPVFQPQVSNSHTSPVRNTLTPFNSLGFGAATQNQLRSASPAVSNPPAPVVNPPSFAGEVLVVDVMGRNVVYSAVAGGLTKKVNGLTSPTLTHLVYIAASGEIKDQTGSTFIVRDLKTDDTLARLAALADASGCRHNIPAVGKSCVVAAHWVDNQPSTSRSVTPNRMPTSSPLL